MEKKELEPQFVGTPWTCDEEIYNHVDELKYTDKKSWKHIRENLISQGLAPEYADSILLNCQMENEDFKKQRVRGIAEFIFGAILLFAGAYVLFGDFDFSLTNKGIIVWLLASVGLMVDGSYHMKRE